MSAATPEAVATSDREIVVRRVLDAPRPLVWKAFTDPRHIDRWWGPDGFRNTTLSMDFRVGGTWRFTMHGPDGIDYQDRVVYRELVEPERMVYDHGSDVDDDPEAFEVTITLNAVEGGTEVVLRSLFRTAAQCAAVRKFGAVDGGRQTLARLDAYVPSMTAAARARTVHDTFVIERRLPHPPSRVFAAFATAEGKARWFIGPPGWTARIREFDFRVGGRERLQGLWSNGKVSDFASTYLDIVPDERIIYAYDMHIDDERISATLATIEFAPDGAGTALKLTEQGAYLDAFDKPETREHGTKVLLDQMAASLGGAA